MARPGPNQPGPSTREMFGRIRASASSLDSLERPPSKILKDDSFSIYEATLMKLKLGAQRDTSASCKEMDEVINDSSVTSTCTEETNMDADCTPATASIVSPVGEIMVMDTDCSSITTSPSFSDGVFTGNSEQRRQSNNVSILHFFKFKDPGHAAVSSSCGEPTSTKNGSSGSISSSSSVESHYRSEMESTQTMEDCELSE